MNYVRNTHLDTHVGLGVRTSQPGDPSLSDQTSQLPLQLLLITGKDAKKIVFKNTSLPKEMQTCQQEHKYITRL